MHRAYDHEGRNSQLHLYVDIGHAHVHTPQPPHPFPKYILVEKLNTINYFLWQMRTSFNQIITSMHI